jgi:16S rRNA (cytosine967-C5)-methyltransferase
MERAALGALIAATVEDARRSTRRADQVVKRALRRAPSLINDERALLARVVHGVRCWQRTLAFLLDDDEAPGAAMAAGWAGLLGALPLAEATGLWPEHAACWASAASNAWRDRLPEDPAARLAISTSVPTWVAAALLTTHDAPSASLLLAEMNAPGPMWLRINRLKTNREALGAALSEEGIAFEEGLLPDALCVRDRLNVRGHPAWQAGAFEVQDLGSQLIAAAVDATPGASVIDVCAGRGGKTLALAAAMRGKGELVAFDVDDTALDALGHRAARAGARVTTVRGDGIAGALAPWTGRADRVLVDAPCTSLGTLRRGPDLRWRVAEEDVARFAAIQRAVLADAATLVRPGGRLVYATCSILRAENDDVADAFNARHPAWRPAPLLPTTQLRFACAARATLSPPTDGTDGFFIAAWERPAG